MKPELNPIDTIFPFQNCLHLWGFQSKRCNSSLVILPFQCSTKASAISSGSVIDLLKQYPVPILDFVGIFHLHPCSKASQSVYGCCSIFLSSYYTIPTNAESINNLSLKSILSLPINNCFHPVQSK